MKKILIIGLVLCMILCSGCTGNKPVKTNTAEQYVIALNPSVMTEDGSVVSVRNSVSSSMTTDIKNDTTDTFYNKTPWQWLTHKDNGEWNLRLIRELSLWTNKNGSPYAYKTDDSRTSSLAVYDSTKMDVEGCTDGELGKNGVIWSFTGEDEEGICYTASVDGLAEFADRNGGKISVVKSLAGVNTAFFNNKNAKSGIILRIYVNNRIYWQEVLNEEKTAVDFPVFTNLELKAGDSIIITAQASDDLNSIQCGNCDIPADTLTVTERTEIINKVEYQTQPPAPTEIPFVFLSESQFTFVSPEKMSDNGQRLVNSFISNVESAIGTTVRYMTDDEEPDEDHMILIGDTAFKESKEAISEIKSTRKNHGADFIIRMVNDKLVIAAENDTSLKFAMEFFLKNYCINDDSVIKTDLEYVSSKYNSPKNVSIDGTALSDYRIVVSRFASLLELDAAEYLVEEIVRLTGGSIPIFRDGETTTKNEILIGDTSRTSSNYSDLASKSVSDDYFIKVSNGKVSVSGNSTAAINAGVKALVTEFEKNHKISNGFTYSGKYDGGYSLTDGYKLTWSDEFNGTELSKTWQLTSRNNPSVYGGTAYTSAKNSYVSEGNLVQKLNRDGKDVIEADVYSQGPESMLYKYGYLEFRIRLAPVVGSWGAFWAMGQVGGTNAGEIDVFENFGSLYSLKSNLHIWGPGDNHDNLLGGTGTILNYAPGTTNPEPFANDYHTIGFEWEMGQFDFYVDGVLAQSYTYDPDSRFNCFDKPVYLILSHWGGEATSAFANCILPDGFTETYIYYDWIRIYQKENNGSVMYVKK